MEIRSYRAVFDLERRIYRVDRIRLNPAGVPVRGVVYALVLIAFVLAAGSQPPLRAIAERLPWYLLDVGLPVGAAAVLCVVRIDGRPFHLAARALLGHRLAARQLGGLRPLRGARLQVASPRDGKLGRARTEHAAPSLRWWPPEILLLPDGSDARMRRLRYVGPGAVLVTVAHECRDRRGRASWRNGSAQVWMRPRHGAGGEATAAREQGDAAVIALAVKTTLRVL